MYDINSQNILKYMDDQDRRISIDISYSPSYSWQQESSPVKVISHAEKERIEQHLKQKESYQGSQQMELTPRIKSKMKTYREQFARMDRIIYQLKEENQDLKQQLEFLRQNHTNLQLKVRNQKEDFQAMKGNMYQEMREKQSQSSRIQIELSQIIKANKNKYEKELYHCTNDYTAKLCAFQTEKARIFKENHQIHKKMESLQQEYKYQKEKVSQLLKDSKEMKQRIKQLEETLNQLHKDHMNLLSRYSIVIFNHGNKLKQMQQIEENIFQLIQNQAKKIEQLESNIVNTQSASKQIEI